MNAIAQQIIRSTKLSPHAESPLLMAGHRREVLPRLFTELGYKVGAEVGVQRGSFSKHLCRTVPGLKLYAVDPWLDYPDYPSCNGQAYKDRLHEIAVEKLAPYNCEIVREASADAVWRFDDGALDFVFIDANHSYDYVRQDIELWSRVVRHGGILAGDDYLNLTHKQVKIRVRQAVDEWTRAQGIDPWFVIVGGTTPVWFWVKE